MKTIKEKVLKWIKVEREINKQFKNPIGNIESAKSFKKNLIKREAND